MVEPLVSVVTPMRNARPYLEAAYASMRRQTWQNWEWLVVDNGSNDGSLEALRSLVESDARVRIFQEPEPGASVARNRALREVKGEFLAFLDVDDVLPPNALSARAERLVSVPDLTVCDGAVETRNADLSEVLSRWSPGFEGDPFPELLRLNAAVFFGLTWMIRRSSFEGNFFDTSISHCEDLLFYLSFGHLRYGYTDEVVLHYRTGNQSLMDNLSGLESSYRYVAEWARSDEGVDAIQSRDFAQRARRIMVRSWLKRGRVIRAFACRVRPW